MNRIFRNDRMLAATLKTEFELTWFAHNYNLKCKHTITHRILSSHRWLDLECLCVSFAFFFSSFLNSFHLQLPTSYFIRSTSTSTSIWLHRWRFRFLHILAVWLCQFTIQMDDDQLHVYKRNWWNTIKLLAFFL